MPDSHTLKVAGRDVGYMDYDVATVRCPVVVLHGEADTIVPVAHARHTAAIVPGATLARKEDS